MKKCILIAFIASVSFSTTSHAGFVMKKQAAVVVTENVAGNNELPVVSNVVANNEPDAAQSKEMVKKQSFFSKMFHKPAAGKAEISKALYVVLAIIGFGWLGMGINDNFEDWDWVLSLVLYILFYLPGLIYTLVKMRKYYK